MKLLGQGAKNIFCTDCGFWVEKIDPKLVAECNTVLNAMQKALFEPRRQKRKTQASRYKF